MPCQSHHWTGRHELTEPEKVRGTPYKFRHVFEACEDITSCRSVGVWFRAYRLAEDDLDYRVEGKVVYVRRGIYKCNVLAGGLRFCKPPQAEDRCNTVRWPARPKMAPQRKT